MVKKICYYILICDSCNKESDKLFNYTGWKTFIDIARGRGWAVSRNRTTCYCPDCAPYYRHAGKKNILVETPAILLKRKIKEIEKK